MSDDTVFCPPEWAPQAGVWVGWPRLPEEWGAAYELARVEIAGFVRALSGFVPVKLAAGSDAAADEAYTAVGDAAEIVRVPTGDIWLRDTGPMVGKTHTGAAAGLCAPFNGWGGKYVMPGDAETAEGICAHEGLQVQRTDMVLEGGAIEQDGAGRLITTRQCLLNDNRNSGWTEVQADTALAACFGATEIIWLAEGLAGDHTDGHVDNLARFVAPGRVVCQRASGTDDPNAATLAAIEASLRNAGLDVATLPSPGLIPGGDGMPTAASHMNFLVTNGAVILPVYEAVHAAEAVSALEALFPGRVVLALPAGHILAGGGSFHCMTREIPVFPID